MQTTRSTADTRWRRRHTMGLLAFWLATAAIIPAGRHYGYRPDVLGWVGVALTAALIICALWRAHIRLLRRAQDPA